MTRTETDKLTAAPIEIVLGGLDITVRPLRGRKAIRWQQEFFKVLPEGIVDDLAITDSGVGFDHADIIKWIMRIAANDLERLFDLLLDYLDLTEADRSTIEENADPGDVIDAAVKVVPLALPLSRLMAWIESLKDDEEESEMIGPAPVPSRAAV